MNPNESRRARFLASLPAILCLGAFVMAQQPRRAADTVVKVQKEWNGGSVAKKDNDLWKQAPKSGVIAGPKAWAKLWQAWHGATAVPQVDFAKELVLVAAGPGPNIVKIDDLKLSDKGNLQFNWSITERGGNGFVYTIQTVQRAGIKTVNGKALPRDWSLEDQITQSGPYKIPVVRAIAVKAPGGPFPGVYKPTPITSADALAKAFPKDDQLAKQVDFAKEQCLYFAWRGSGQDQLTFEIEPGKASLVVMFSFSPGTTEDWRPHYHLFAMPKNATWRFDYWVPAVQEIKPRHLLQAPAGGIAALAITADGATLAVAGGDKTVQVWDTVRGKEVASLRGLATPVTAMAFSADGKTLATLSKDKTVRVWNVRSGKEPIVHQDASAEAGLLALAADGKVLLAYVVAGKDKQPGPMAQDWVEARLLDVATGKHRTLTRASTPEGIPGISANLKLLAFTPDGTTLAVGSLDVGGGLNLILLDTVTGKQRESVAGLLPRDADDPSRLAFSQDGKTIAFTVAGQIQTRDVASGKVRARRKAPAHLTLIAADLRTLVSVDAQGAIRVSGTPGTAVQPRRGAKASGVQDYLAKDGKLTEKLTLEIGQGGGGISGAYTRTVWVIEPGGAWAQETREGLAGGEQKRTRGAQGQLTEGQVVALAHHFAAQDFQALPVRVTSGRAPDSSGGLDVAIHFGKKRTDLSTALIGLGDSAPKADDPRAAEWSRFVALTLVLEDVLKRTRVEPKNGK